MFLLVLLTILFTLTICWYKYYNYFEKHLKKFPGPKPWPLIGDVLLFRNDSDPFGAIVRLSKQYGPVFKFNITFDSVNLVINDLKMLEFVLSSNKILDKSTGYKHFHKWLGNGLLTSAGEKWKNQRKMLTPTFHFKILEGFINIFNLYGNTLISNLEKEMHNLSVDVFLPISLYTLDVICASSMGINIDAQKTNSEYTRAVKDVLRIIINRSSSIVKSFNLLYYFTYDFFKEHRLVQLLHNFTESVINKRRKQILNNIDNDLSSDDLGIKKRLTFLDLLLENQNKKNLLSDKDIREEVDTFMFAGHDTTAIAISFILYCLANNPKEQEKVVEELITIVDKNKNLTYQDLQNMKYLEMVIKESLRLFPPVPVYGRTVTENTNYNGDIFPKGLILVISPYILHRDSNIYPDPEKFIPERFSAENQSKRSPYAYIPFSAGPRNCIGQKFAMLEMKSIITKVLMHFVLLPAIPKHTPKLVGFAVLKSENGVCIRLKKRDL